MVSKKLFISNINTYFSIYIKNMKFSKKLILAFLASTMFWFTWVFAAWIDHFEVSFYPDNVKVWEALDLTIEAVDKNNVTVLDYDWTILIFSESDPEAELPSELDENTYTFTAADQWKIKFENAIKFKNPWLQNIHIYDFIDDTIFWVAETDVSEDNTDINVEIQIVSPDSGITIWKNSITVSWTTKKNHQVKIIVNWMDEVETTSNNDWIFEELIDILEDWDNTLMAQVLDSDLNVIWVSEVTNIRVDLSSLSIKNVKLTPDSVYPESSFEIEVIATPKLIQIEAIINDVLISLKETRDWVYLEKSTAPKDAWIYKVDIKIRDELGHEKTELWAASLTVKEPELESAPETDTGNDDDNNGDDKEVDYRDLSITWLKLVELKTRSILTWDELDDIEWYNVYKKLSEWKMELVENVQKAKFEIEIIWDKIKYDYFAIKAIAKTNSWELYEWALSDATKIKTGPEILILFILSLLVGWIIFITKQKRA